MQKGWALRRGSRSAAVLLLIAVPSVGAATAPRAEASLSLRRALFQQVRLTLRGRVFDDVDEPIADAIVLLEPPEAVTGESARSGADGSFVLHASANAGLYRLRVTCVGYAPQTIPVEVRSRDTTINVVVHLNRTVQSLTPVHTVAGRPRTMRDDRGRGATPGSDQETLDMSSGLNGDLSGDFNSALAMIPGVSVMPGMNGLAPTAFGLDADQNGSTLNGVDLVTPALPRDGLVGVVHLSTYDPRVGRFAGLQTSWSLPSGSYQIKRSLHVTIDERDLQVAPPAFNQLGSRYDNVIASGASSGNILGSDVFYSSAFQLSNSIGDLATLNSVSASGLRAIGVSRDSVDRLLSIAAGDGVILSPRGAPGARSTTAGSAVARVDLVPAFRYRPVSNSGNVFYLLGAFAGTSTDGIGAAPTATASSMSETHATSAQLLADYETYLGNALSVSKTSIALGRNVSRPLVDQPQASVLVNSDFATGGQDAVLLALGGAPQPGVTTQSVQWETSSDLSFNTSNHQNNFDVYADTKLSDFISPRFTPQPGQYSYNSIADFAAGHPSTYTRVTTAAQPAIASASGVLAVSDIYAPRQPGAEDKDGLTIQYGLRTELSRFSARQPFNPDVDSLFLRRTDHLPNDLSVAPMVGFTWNEGTFTERSGPVVFSDTRNSISGGVRQYRGTVSPALVGSVARQTGLAGAGLEIDCVGGAVPPADWTAFSQSAASIPSTCADGTTGSPLAQAARPVSLFAPNYNEPSSWREELKWRWLISGHLAGSLGFVNSLNTALSDPFDLNFSPHTVFTLSDEGNRPVFVTRAGIDPTTGAVSSAQSRLFPQFGQITELRSDLRSNQQLATMGLTYRIGTSAFVSPAATAPPRFSGTISASYAYARGSIETRGFSATTAADPSEITTAAAAAPRHSLQVVLNARRDRWISLSASARLTSGIRFTPLVGSDINGDGLANDRAFVFAAQPDPSGQSVPGLSALMAGAPTYARDCLLRQVGQVAGPASCVGPWSATLGTVAIAIDPYRVHLGNRGSLSLFINNFLGGLDQLVHGESRLQGWGQIAIPDPTLLYVRGFDASTGRFQYAANPDFGSTAANRNALRPPFRITLDARFDVGPNSETQLIKNTFSAPPLGMGVPSDSGKLQQWLIARANFELDELAQIIAASDSIHLSTAQQDSIGSLRRSFLAARDSIYGALARFLVTREGNFDGPAVREAWHGAIATSVRKRLDAGMAVRAVVSPSQYEWLQRHSLTSSLDYSPDWLARALRAPLLSPR